MVVAGNVDPAQVKQLAVKWFEPIDAGVKPVRKLPAEPRQTQPRRLTVFRDVPADSIYKAYHMCSRLDEAYHTIDLISDILSRGNSSRLYKSLIKERQLFSEVNAYVMGDLDKGLFVISGKLPAGITPEEAERGLLEELEKIKKDLVDPDELQKCKNKTESSITFSETDVLTKATNLAISELIGDAGLINKEIEKYAAVTAQQIREQANLVLDENNCSTLFYLIKN
jgi:predicted Zn-dependent peptidase